MKKVVLLFGCLVIVYSLHAQDDIDQFLQANIEDAGKLTVDYISPVVKGVGSGINNGWYNTAKPHAKGFDLTFTISAVFVPDKEQLSRFVGSEFNDLELLSPANSLVPTVFGPEELQPQYLIPSTGESFTGPAGNSLEDEIGFNAVPVPCLLYTSPSPRDA